MYKKRPFRVLPSYPDIVFDQTPWYFLLKELHQILLTKFNCYVFATISRTTTGIFFTIILWLKSALEEKKRCLFFYITLYKKITVLSVQQQIFHFLPILRFSNSSKFRSKKTLFLETLLSILILLHVFNFPNFENKILLSKGFLTLPKKAFTRVRTILRGDFRPLEGRGHVINPGDRFPSSLEPDTDNWTPKLRTVRATAGFEWSGNGTFVVKESVKRTYSNFLLKTNPIIDTFNPGSVIK